MTMPKHPEPGWKYCEHCHAAHKDTKPCDLCGGSPEGAKALFAEIANAPDETPPEKEYTHPRR